VTKGKTLASSRPTFPPAVRENSILQLICRIAYGGGYGHDQDKKLDIRRSIPESRANIVFYVMSRRVAGS